MTDVIVVEEPTTEVINEIIQSAVIEVVDDTITVQVVQELVTVEQSEISVQTLEIQTEGPQGPPGELPTPKSADFTYTSGALSRIDYEDGSYKTMTYSGGLLTQSIFIEGDQTTTTGFTYSGSGDLISTEVTIT